MANQVLINDAANIFRISSSTLRFYEKKNVLSPSRGGDNSYRYYTQDDIRRLSCCRFFQNLGFSLSEIVEIFQDSSEAGVNARLETKEAELVETIKKTTEALEAVQRLRRAEKIIQTCRGQFFIQNNPHVLFSWHSEFDTLNRENIKTSYWDAVAENYNLFDCAVIISPQIAYASDFSEKMKRGYAIEYQTGAQLGLNPSNSILELKPRRCVYTVFQAEPIVSYQQLEPVYAWMKQCGFQLTGNILCRTIKISFNQGNDSRYYEAWLPID